MSTISKALPTPPDNFSTQIASATFAPTDLSVTLDDATDLPSEGVGQFFKKDANGEIIAGSVEFAHWTNKSSNTLTFSDTGDRGITGSDSGAQSYVADDYFEVWVSSYYNFRDAWDEEHTATGGHSSISLTGNIDVNDSSTAIRDSSDNELLKFAKTASAVNELTVTNAATAGAPKLSATGGDTNIDIKLEPKGTGVIKAKTTVELECVAAGTDTSTGDSKRFFRVPLELNGMDLVAVAACVATAGTTNTTDVQVHRVRSGSSVDMLSTKITIDSGEVDTSTAATAAVINTSNDDVQTGDQIHVDLDSVSTTPAKGLVVALTFATP